MAAAGNMDAISGRAPLTSVASPMYLSVPAGSPATGARRIRTRVTPLSSSAQPVTATDPVTPVAFCVGVSKLPKGGTVVGTGTMAETSFDDRLLSPVAV